MTVAMYMAHNGFIPSKEWEHNPLIYNSSKQTFAIILANKGIIPPD